MGKVSYFSALLGRHIVLLSQPNPPYREMFLITYTEELLNQIEIMIGWVKVAKYSVQIC